MLGGDYSVPYIDVKDAQWKNGGELTPVDIRDISASQFVIYRLATAKLPEGLISRLYIHNFPYLIIRER